MISNNQFRGKNVFVLGLGRTGLSVLTAFQKVGIKAVGWDDNPKSREEARSFGFKIEDITFKTNWQNTDLLVISPGIPYLYPKPHQVIANARKKSVIIDNDMGIFFSALNMENWYEFDRQPKIIAVTGSNGKSTTSYLIKHIITNAGIRSEIGGHFGRPVLSFLPFTDGDVKIIELSSYQLEVARYLKADINIFLNFSPDHLERHGGIGGYFNAKKRLFTDGSSEKNIVCVDDIEGEYLYHSLESNELTKGLNVALSSSTKNMDFYNSVSIEENYLVEKSKGRRIASIDITEFMDKLKVYNYQNICAAYAACRALNISPKIIENSLKTFGGLPHRNQFILEKSGIKYINDSKATNVESVKNSISHYDNIHLILGGLPKEGGIINLVKYMGKVKRVYLIGDAVKLFSEQLSGSIDFEISNHLEVAIRSARRNATNGDCILLAPACASFDQFKDFEERGNKFISLVKGLQN